MDILKKFFQHSISPETYSGEVYFPYVRGNRISLEASRWIARHVIDASYEYDKDTHLHVYYNSDGTPPPIPQNGMLYDD